MGFSPVSLGALQAAQILTGLTMALWLAVGFVPALRSRARRIRAVILGAYLLCCAGLLLYTMAT